MLVTLPGMVMEVRFEQELKALLSILITLFGMVMEVRFEQEKKAHCPIVFTPLIKAIVFILVRDEYQGDPSRE
jgi:hypothetical protein